VEALLSVIEITATLVFAYSGRVHARKSGYDYVGVLTIALVTAFGGVLRDILSNQKPQLVQPTEPIYATCAFVGAWVYISMLRLNFLPTFALIVCIAVTSLLRIVAITFNLRLPF
jgi:uncharacterized membrane protein YeiH